MITIDLGSAFVTNLILLVLAIFGFSRGFRYMVSIALFTTIGYLLTVQGGNYIVGLINRIWSSLPRLFALLTGGGGAEPLPPIIPDNLQAPLLLRVLVFLGLLAVGIGYAWPWEGKPLAGFQGFRQLRVLGALTGLYIGVLLISALATFWSQASAVWEASPLLERALSGLPNYAGVVPSAIAAFFVLLVVVIILRFDRIWRA
ncbi:MAG TPA: hypothetical protein VNL77_23525 [Roseiflexaceae bacterium]|nr:hypothetical protein [Roseiflexaceae bacterium]